LSAAWEWLDSAVVAGDVSILGHDVRLKIFEAVRADRDGPTARRLLTFTSDRHPSVRRTVFDLLGDLCAPDCIWAGAAEVAEHGLGDADEQVRRAAAGVLVTAGGIDQAVAALDTSADPVVRIALVEAMAVAAVSHRDGGRWSQVVIRLRADPVSAVRLLANVEALQAADAAAWPAVDAAIHADLALVDGALGAAGSRSSRTASERWALALVGLGREHDCCAWAERLADFEIHVLARIGPAAEAVVPLMRRYVAVGGPDADLAVRALLMITLDRAVADRFLAERPEQPRRCRIAPALLTWLADHGGLTDRQHRQLRHVFTQPGAMQVRTAGPLWRCEGPSVAGQLLEQLPKYVDDDAFGPEALRVLAAMDAYA